MWVSAAVAAVLGVAASSAHPNRWFVTAPARRSPSFAPRSSALSSVGRHERRRTSAFSLWVAALRHETEPEPVAVQPLLGPEAEETTEFSAVTAGVLATQKLDTEDQWVTPCEPWGRWLQVSRRSS